MTAPEIRVFDNLHDLSREGAEILAQAAGEQSAHGRILTAALSGGSTPRSMFQVMGGPPFLGGIVWRDVHLFQVDERAVPIDDPQSNYKMIQESLLSHFPRSGPHFHRMQAERPDLEVAAGDYADELRATLGANAGGFPRFELIFLGMGPDGHTASLFPGTAALAEQTRWVIPNYVAKFKMHRLTLTFPVINAAAHVVFMVAGADKSDALRDVLQAKSGKEPLPAQRIQPVDGRLTWLIDREAGRLL